MRILKKLLFWLQMRFWGDFCNREVVYARSYILFSVIFG